jgi:hypothetical protein
MTIIWQKLIKSHVQLFYIFYKVNEPAIFLFRFFCSHQIKSAHFHINTSQIVEYHCKQRGHRCHEIVLSLYYKATVLIFII